MRVPSELPDTVRGVYLPWHAHRRSMILQVLVSLRWNITRQSLAQVRLRSCSRGTTSAAAVIDCCDLFLFQCPPPPPPIVWSDFV